MRLGTVQSASSAACSACALLLGAVVLATAPPALGEGAVVPTDPEAWCGDDYWFKFEEPSGWQSDREPSGESLTLLYWPEGQQEERAQITMGLMLTLSSGWKEDVTLDVEEVLQGWVSLVNVFGSPAEMRPFELKHPHFPTAGIELVFPLGRGILVAVDPQSGRGNSFLAKLDGVREPSTSELAAFRRMVRSIRFDPELYCSQGPDDTIITHRRPRRSPPATKAAPAAAKRGFSLKRASQGCTMLYELFVPIDCSQVEVGGRPAVLVRFEGGDELAETYLERFRGRVTTPWCYEAKRHPGPDVPALVFALDEKGERLREHSCETGGWGREIAPDRVQPAE